MCGGPAQDGVQHSDWLSAQSELLVVQLQEDLSTARHSNALAPQPTRVTAQFVSAEGAPLYTPDVRLEERMPNILVQIMDGNNKPVREACMWSKCGHVSNSECMPT